jgi:protein ImuA
MWTPPLLILVHLARQVKDAAAEASGWSIWIGHKVWLYGQAASHGLGGTARSLWVDTPNAGTRMWAVEAALRCPGLVVVADGSGFDGAASRRLQLAASASGTVGLLTRPMAEAGEISFSVTRWTVHTHPASELCTRWRLTLVRCKGMPAVESPEWLIERTRHGGLGCVSPDAADRLAPASAAS